MPIPSHPKKVKQRGYNQAAVISQVIAEKLKIKHSPNLLQRVHLLETQTQKTRNDRAFSTEQPFIQNLLPEPGTHILIIDDIITTGNTIEAACNAFVKRDIKLSVATLAFTLKH